MSIASRISELVALEEQLAENITSKGVAASRGDGFSSLVPKVLQISGGGAIDWLGYLEGVMADNPSPKPLRYAQLVAANRDVFDDVSASYGNGGMEFLTSGGASYSGFGWSHTWDARADIPCGEDVPYRWVLGNYASGGVPWIAGNAVYAVISGFSMPKNDVFKGRPLLRGFRLLDAPFTCTSFQFAMTYGSAGCRVFDGVDFSAITAPMSGFFPAALTTIKNVRGINVSMDLSPCSMLTRGSLLAVIGALNVTSGQVLKLGAAHLGRLSAEEKATVTQKGWTLE